MAFYGLKQEPSESQSSSRVSGLTYNTDLLGLPEIGGQMSWLNQVGTLLHQYTNPEREQPNAHNDFAKVASVAPKPTIASGLAEAFRSEQTPPFGELLSSLFRQSNGEQKAGILNHLLSSAGPGLLSQIAGAAPGLAALLGRGNRKVTPEEAETISPDAVHQIASRAEQENPNIIESVSHFYADHPMLVKALGAAAVTIAIRNIAHQNKAG
jgi:hypothetical protein